MAGEMELGDEIRELEAFDIKLGVVVAKPLEVVN